MLRMDPEHRLNALECLAHPYFEGIRDPEIEKLVQSVQVNQNRRDTSKSRGSIRSNTNDAR
jgi:hypothetical protein